MCGIIAVLSSNYSVAGILLEGLREIQNRGYDSMGVSLITPPGEYYITKDINSPDILAKFQRECREVTSFNGIAHTRWATHGGVSKTNAHPHCCYQGLFCLVHNGIIENFAQLKAQLHDKDIPCVSQTDSEVIVNHISFTFSLLREATPGISPRELICQSIATVCANLHGTFGLVIQYRHLPQVLFCIRCGSPLVVGVADDFMMIASERGALDPRVHHYTALHNHDLIVLNNTSQNIVSIHNRHMYTLKIHDATTTDRENPFSSWTEKEIREQPDACRRCINFGSRVAADRRACRLGGLSSVSERIQDTRHIVMLGCGTSYHSCLTVARHFREMTWVDTVQVCDASEFDLNIIPRSGQTVVIVTSQSGETIDLAFAIDKIRIHHPDILILGVINVVDSLIANAVDAGVYTNCGKERGVASTKSFMTQVIVLFLVSFYFIRDPTTQSRALLQSIVQFPESLESHLQSYFDQVRRHIATLAHFQNIFVVGRSLDYYIAMEGSLKIKEMSYIHSEAYSSSSLKHGPFALLDQTMLVILISTKSSERVKIENAYQEIASRNAPILLISDENMFDCPLFIAVPQHAFAFLEAMCVLQVLALELCHIRHHDPDHPRNLAKVVTVE